MDGKYIWFTSDQINVLIHNISLLSFYCQEMGESLNKDQYLAMPFCQEICGMAVTWNKALSIIGDNFGLLSGEHHSISLPNPRQKYIMPMIKAHDLYSAIDSFKNIIKAYEQNRANLGFVGQFRQYKYRKIGLLIMKKAEKILGNAISENCVQ